LEAQSDSQAHFNRRLFFYFAILHQRHRQPIYPIVIFSFDKPKRAEPDSYTVEFSDRKVLEFNFATVQLNRLNWRDYIHQPNPVAAALMSKMKIAKADRPKVKAECLRLLVTLRLDPAKTRLVSKFVDTYLRSDGREESVFQAEVDKLEPAQKEGIMETLTSWEEKVIEKATQTIALNMLKGNLPLEQISQFTGLTIAQLQHLRDQGQRSSD
jgi:predicted transposase YdaD